MSSPRSVIVALGLGLVATLTGLPTAGPVTSAVAGVSSTSPQVGQTATAADRQRVRLLMHPQLAQPGAGDRRARGAKSAMSVVVKPAREGRRVVLQRRTSDGWSSVASHQQNRRGIAEFTAAYRRNGEVQTYRAFAVRYRDLGRVTSAAVATDKWGAADFTDEFSGKALGDAWSHRLQGYRPDSMRKCSRAGKRAVRVGRGTVRLSVLNDPSRPSARDRRRGTEKCRYDGRRWTWRLNGSIGTQGVKSFKYGYAAARVKFQPRRGQHAAFWLQPDSQTALEGSPDKTGAEIDVIEWFGQGHPSGGLTSFIYYYPKDGKPGITPKKVGGFIRNPGRFGSNWASRYHVFSVEWTPQRYVFRIDGKETFRTSKGVSGRPQYPILSLLSSDYELQYLGGDNRLPQTMSVDWMRYWAR